MLYRLTWLRSLLILAIVCFTLPLLSFPAQAADAYVSRYLQVQDAVALPLDDQGNNRSFTAAELSTGKKLFEQNCLTCHVGGATLPDPTVSLALKALKAATPPRDTINQLVRYMRHPTTYDGTEETFSCRKVSPTWLSEAEVTNLAGFILRAAEKAPGWGTDQF